MNAKWLIGCFVCAGALLQADDVVSSETTKVAPKPTKQQQPVPCKPAKPQPPECGDPDLFRRDVEVFSIHGGFLFWRVQEGSLDYALKMDHPAQFPGYAQGKFHTATFDGEPGFRIAASYFRAPKYWEVWGQYTRIVANGTNHVGQPGVASEYLTGTWPQVITTPLAEARSHIHMNYNVADLLVDRFFNPNPHLRLRLQGGAVVAVISQTWKVTYTDAVNNSTNIHSRWNFVGGGFRIGTMIDWFWGYDIYVTALGSVGTLLGSYHNTTRQTATTVAQPVRNAHFSDVRPTVTAQALFGPSWQKNFKAARVEIFAGYELNTWFNLQEVYRSSKLGVSTDAAQTWINTSLIALQGLTTRVTLDF